MKIHLDCIPCYIDQALEASRYAKMSEDERWDTIKAVCKELSFVDRDSPSAQISQRVHKIVRDRSKVEDPYIDKKKEGNKKAREYLEDFEESVEISSKPLKNAAKLAAVGNIVDFGPRKDFNIKAELKKSLKEEFALDHWSSFKKKLDQANAILYFSDNSGEIIYDLLFMRHLLDHRYVDKIDLVVKDGPFLNDVTENDVEKLGIDKIEGINLKTVDNGDGGKSPTLWSSEVRNWIEDYDLVISKGQANYEGLSGYSYPNLFFLLAIKCPLIEKDIGIEEGKKVLLNASRLQGKRPT